MVTMADFVCRTHKKYFRSHRALDRHIDQHHNTEGTVHCAYRDPSVPLSARRHRESFADIRAFVGEGLKKWSGAQLKSKSKSKKPMSPQETVLLHTLQMLYESPRFIADAVKGMRSKSMRRLYPDVHVRYEHVLTGMDASDTSDASDASDALMRFKRQSRMKHAVFSIMLPPI